LVSNPTIAAPADRTRQDEGMITPPRQIPATGS
jgi:hypothetical protein